MNHPRILTVIYAGILLWIAACTTDHNNNDLLSEAIDTVDNNPKEALALLESISPDMYDYDKDQHMQFVVTLTQARYMDYQDITGDSLILDAQRYFVRSRNYEMAARASYYAAIYWHEGEAGDKAVEYWQAAFLFAEKAGNDLFMAKSAYSLGQFYYNLEQWEDAMPYCLKALELYKNDSNAEHYKLDIIEMLGQIYREQQDLEQAYLYFDNGLKAAKKLNNTKYESRFLRNKGIIHWEKKEYQLAKEYLDLALSNQPEPEDKLRIYLSYAKLYRDINRPDSTLHYLSMIEDRIPEITYPITRRDIYSELVTYYKVNQGDGDKIVRYSQLAHKEDLHIQKSQSDKKINAINQQLEQLKQKKLTEGKTYRRIFDYGLIVVCLLAFLLAMIWFNRRALKEKYTQVKDKYTQAKDNYALVTEKYEQTNEKYEQMHEKYIQTHAVQFYKTVDLLRLAIDGLDSVAKCTEDLHQKELANTGSPVWEQQLVLREKFSTHLAEHTRKRLEKLSNGGIALLNLPPEYLSIIQLVRMKYPDEKVSWLLGYKDNTKKSVKDLKEQIRVILTEAGMNNENIKELLPEKRIK